MLLSSISSFGSPGESNVVLFFGEGPLGLYFMPVGEGSGWKSKELICILVPLYTCSSKPVIQLYIFFGVLIKLWFIGGGDIYCFKLCN